MATNSTGGLLGSNYTTGMDGKPIDYSKQINSLYQSTLGRDADQGGMEYWQGRLRSGSSLSDIQKDISNSEEAVALRASSTPPNAKAATARATAVGYDPTDVKVGSEASAANQLASITAKGSPLLTQAETDAKRTSAARGLLNSSIAAGAGREAVYRTAMPLAQQDASTYYDATKTNATQRTAAAAFKANADNQASLANTAQENAIQQSFITRSIAEADNKVKLQLQQLDSDTKVKLQGLEAEDKQLLQTNISAANAYAQLAQALASISTSTTMDAAAKQQATDNQINLYKQNLQAIGQVSGLDLSKYFNQVQASTSQQGSPSTGGGAGGGGAGDPSGGRPGMNGSLTEWG